MSETDKQEIRDLIVATIQETSIGRCCAEHCGERCGITPIEHAQQHKEWKSFNTSIENLGRKAIGTVVAVVVGFVLLALAKGFVDLIKNFKG